MKILMTGFTSRTIGSDRNTYDYVSNVFLLRRVLELGGHEVDIRKVSLETDVCVEEDYDCALVGVGACQGLSSRYKLGALWALSRFGKRAAIFPSDGKNVYIFPSSVRTCLTGTHADHGTPITPIDYFLGKLQGEKCNIWEAELGGEAMYREVWQKILEQLPHVEGKAKCSWPVLVPLHSWGDARAYERHYGAPTMMWDPTRVAIESQYSTDELASDGRFVFVHEALANERERRWVCASLQDNAQWLKKQKLSWPVIEIGNKRKAAAGQATEFVPEKQLVDEYYRHNWGNLAFGYTLAEYGWWRMRFVHAGMAGQVAMADDATQMRMPLSYRQPRSLVERWPDEKLASVAQQQWIDLKSKSWSTDQAVQAVDDFVKELMP